MKGICSASLQPTAKCFGAKTCRKTLAAAASYGATGSPLVDGNLVLSIQAALARQPSRWIRQPGLSSGKRAMTDPVYSSPVAFDLAGTRCIAVFKGGASWA